MPALILLLSFIFMIPVHALSVMSYNAENLFDAHHDIGKEDFTFLPLKKKSDPEVQTYCKSLPKLSWMDSCLNLNWNNEAFYKKAFNLAKVIKAYKGGADIVVLQEVENKKALDVLMNIALEDYGYIESVLIEGPDLRGIDVAILSKYPVISKQLHQIELEGRPTRGILEVIVEVNSKPVAVFANHWPSQGNPTPARIAAANTLKTAIENVKAKYIIAAGDFNTLDHEMPHPYSVLAPLYLTDVEAVARKERLFLHQGTHWYKGHWSSLDKIFVKNTENSGFMLDAKSFDILNLEWMMKKLEWFNQASQEIETHTVPRRFSRNSHDGYSDHLPIVVEIKEL
jgi:endonuclease/exonuclease/phosphatase family metal-dependent hydrolase